jgi:hypothetical protein
MKFDVIVPATAETALTGYVMGAAKRIGKSDWRLEVYRGETLPRVYRDNEAQSSTNVLPPAVMKFWVAFKSSALLQYAMNA